MIDRHHVEALRATLAGEVILPADAAYEECRKIFNAMHDKRPAVIARCRSTADVVAAVNFAREHGLLVAVRSGGHSVAGLSICDDGILIDLERPEEDRGRSDGANRPRRRRCPLGRVRRRHQQHGLHTPGGRVTTTGVGGFTTGGGYGWTSSKHGLTCDNLVSAEVVLADGRVVRASEQRERRSLLGHPRRRRQLRHRHRVRVPAPSAWTDRPGGPGAVADRARPRRHARMARLYGRRSRRALDGVRRPHRSARAFVPESLQGRWHSAWRRCTSGIPATGATVIQPLKDLRPAVDLIQPMPYTAFQAIIDPMAPKGYRSYWRGEYLQSLSDERHRHVRPARAGAGRSRNARSAR